MSASVKPHPMAYFGYRCFHCDQEFHEEGDQAFVNCPKCRPIIKDETERERVRREVDRMDWPDVIEV